MPSDNDASPRSVTGCSLRIAAMPMDLGKRVGMRLPPLPLLWLGGSMLVLASHRHHPIPRVGEYTQAPADRFCALIGSIILICREDWPEPLLDVEPGVEET